MNANPCAAVWNYKSDSALDMPAVKVTVPGVVPDPPHALWSFIFDSVTQTLFDPTVNTLSTSG